MPVQDHPAWDSLRDKLYKERKRTDYSCRVVDAAILENGNAVALFVEDYELDNYHGGDPSRKEIVIVEFDGDKQIERSSSDSSGSVTPVWKNMTGRKTEWQWFVG